jgi:hypothetical protein
VGAQLIQTPGPSAKLQAFKGLWPGPLSYPLLLESQSVIIAAGMWAAWVMWTGQPGAQPRLGRVIVWIGWVYMVGAAFRFFAGLTFLSAIPALDVQLPGFFHFVLAGMVLTFAAHLADEARGRSPGRGAGAPKGRVGTTRRA